MTTTTAGNTAVGVDQGGGALFVKTGGVIRLESGGILALETGATMTINGETITLGELGYLDGLTAGTVTASKALVVDASKGIATITTATITTLTSTTANVPTVNATNVDAGASGTAGTVDVYPATATSGKIALTAANSAGDYTTTIVNASMAAARTLTIPDPGGAASFVMTEGAQTVNGVKTLGSTPVLPAAGITLGSTTFSEATLALYAKGVAAGVKIAFGESVLDGSNPTTVASGLATITAAIACLKGSAAPAASTSLITTVINGTDIDVYGWKPTGAALTDLIASTGTEGFYWVAIGT